MLSSNLMTINLLLSDYTPSDRIIISICKPWYYMILFEYFWRFTRIYSTWEPNWFVLIFIHDFDFTVCIKKLNFLVFFLQKCALNFGFKMPQLIVFEDYWLWNTNFGTYSAVFPFVKKFWNWDLPVILFLFKPENTGLWPDKLFLLFYHHSCS